ncbi:MAG: hypothetical protein HRT69_14715 [Flavobacteriaceae bacterium]|nr:hypothetical protein [Flavobacteriaceae bacterium]
MILLNFWNKLNKTSKLLLVAVIFLFCFAIYYGSSKAYYKYKYFKEVENKYNTSLNEIKSKDILIDSILNTYKESTKKVRKASKTIDSKLKQDEEIINTSSISDDELNKFISRHTN